MAQSRAEKTAYMREWQRRKMQDPIARAKRDEHMRKWAEANRTSLQAKRRERYLSNRKTILAELKAFRKANPEWCKSESIRRREYRRNYHLRSKYATTPDCIYELLAKQNDACAICHEAFPLTDRPNSFWGKEFHIDHCHATNIVRGLLCFSCNQGIGSLKDSQANALSAADYLGRFISRNCADNSEPA